MWPNVDLLAKGFINAVLASRLIVIPISLLTPVHKSPIPMGHCNRLDAAALTY